MSNFEYQFQLIDKDDPGAAGGVLVPRADVVIENRSKSPEKETSKERSKSSDLYSELLKLDDLRKRGIISDAEFEAQKAKLLRSN